MREAHVGTVSGMLHVIMGIGATVGTADTALLLGRWRRLYSHVAVFQQIFLGI